MGDQTLGSPKNLFVITGPPGSGKTPIVRQLVALGFTGVPEPAREVIAEQRAIRGEGIYDRNPQLFLNLMLSRAVADFRHKSGASRPVFFDRGIPDQIGYAELFGLDASDAANAATVHRYNDLVFALPSWPDIYVTDSERRMTFEAAKAFGERFDVSTTSWVSSSACLCCCCRGVQSSWIPGSHRRWKCRWHCR